MKAEEIKKLLENFDHDVYGVRVDSISYNIGDIADNSHELFQDPDFGEDGELIYPYIEEGRYKGFYDAGELDGTCTIGFDKEDEGSIKRALDMVKIYQGNFMHILGGYCAEEGNDRGEVIISDAEVLLCFEKDM